MQDIPVVDIGPLRDGTNITAVGQELGWAASDIRFIYIENHGLPRAMVKRARHARILPPPPLTPGCRSVLTRRRETDIKVQLLHRMFHCVEPDS